MNNVNTKYKQTHTTDVNIILLRGRPENLWALQILPPEGEVGGRRREADCLELSGAGSCGAS